MKPTLAAFAALMLVPAFVRADAMDASLLKQTRPLFEYLRKREAKSVGVLKFRCRKGDEAESLNVGPINSKMAEQVESVLLLGRDLPLVAGAKPVTVFHDASGTAAACKKGLDYVTPEGRRGLMDVKYQPADGGAPMEADILITGSVRIDPRAKTTTVVIRAFGRDAAAPEEVSSFTVNTDRATMADVGQGFAMAKRDIGAGPVEPKELPVELKLFINAAEAAIKDGRFGTSEPKPGDKAYFTLRNTAKERIAAVLRVDGLNVIDEETVPAIACAKWVLEPGAAATKIEGFYTATKLYPFAVKDAAPSSEPMADSARGTVSLHVFVEGETAERADSLPSTRGLSPRSWADKRGYDALGAALSKGLPSATRGFIAKGDAVEGRKPEATRFVNPREVGHVMVRYGDK